MFSIHKGFFTKRKQVANKKWLMMDKTCHSNLIAVRNQIRQVKKERCPFRKSMRTEFPVLRRATETFLYLKPEKVTFAKSFLPSSKDM